MATVDSLLAQIWTHHQQGKVKAAEAGYRELLTKAPNSPNAHVYLGIALFDLRRYEEAVASYKHALKLQPFFPIAWNNLGNALRMLRENDKADQAFETALEQKPGYVNALKNRGTLWVWAGEIEQGLRWYEEGLKLSPDDFELHRNLGVIYLLLGRFEEGWKEYRWRWKAPGMLRPNIKQPLWQGAPLKDKTIFVYPEQGLGDAIQFVRTIPHLTKQGASVLLGCEAKLVPLFSNCRGVGQIVPIGGTMGSTDYHASLVDVVDYCWGEPNLISGEPYLDASENLIGYWNRWLTDSGLRRIGICWQGNPDHHADPYRSIPLADFKQLFQIADVHWISLQFGFGSEQLNNVTFADQITVLPENLDKTGGAFLDTAAVLKNLDLLITVDTSVGHLAGALGVPTWLLLNKVPDWRWGMTGDKTPWYNHHRLWRQSDSGDWNPVIQSLAAELAKVARHEVNVG